MGLGACYSVGVANWAAAHYMHIGVDACYTIEVAMRDRRVLDDRSWLEACYGRR